MGIYSLDSMNKSQVGCFWH